MSKQSKPVINPREKLREIWEGALAIRPLVKSESDKVLCNQIMGIVGELHKAFEPKQRTPRA